MQINSYTASGKPPIHYLLLLVCALITGGLLSGLDGGTGLTASSLPFVVSIVPATGGITMAKNNAHEFYVVLTNVTSQPQAVWQSWNSWGYQAVSFELTTTDGKKFALLKKEEEFSRNGPTTFVIEPGEHQVFPIKLDEWWETHPALPKTNDMPIKLKAIYEVHPTPEATEFKVWTGRLESHSYNLSLLQW